MTGGKPYLGGDGWRSGFLVGDDRAGAAIPTSQQKLSVVAAGREPIGAAGKEGNAKKRRPHPRIPDEDPLT